MSYIEDSFAGAYPWDYLKPENSDRPAILEKIVGPFIGGKGTVIDMLCGFSPLSSFLLAKGCRVVGFDKSPEAIAYCNRAYPLGAYRVADDADILIRDRVDVLLHLGIAPGTDPFGLESRTEVNTSIRTIRETLPRLVVLESAVNYADGYNALKSLVEDLKVYRLQAESTYEFQPLARSINPAIGTTCERILSVYTKERQTCSLSDETITRFFSDLNPASQAESISDLNLGFGFLYYAMGRIIRPKSALVLGSKMGFSAISMALSMRDNANGGKLILVDAGYSDTIDGADRGMGGIAFWKDAAGVANLLKQFDVADIMEVKVMKTSEFAKLHKEQGLPPVDLLLIDADHSYEGFRYDFETYSDLLSDNGLILCHDTEVVDDGSSPYPFGVRQYFRKVIRQSNRYEAISLPVWPGLGIVRKAGPARTSGARLLGLVPTSYYSSAGEWMRDTYRRLPLPADFRWRLESGYGRIFNRGARIRRRRQLLHALAGGVAKISGVIPASMRRRVSGRIKQAFYHYLSK